MDTCLQPLVSLQIVENVKVSPCECVLYVECLVTVALDPAELHKMTVLH